MAVKDYYEAYWSPEGTGTAAYIELYPELRQILEAHIPRMADCLDVGCGTGRVCGLWLRDHARNYVGVDISANAVAEARASGLDARVIEDAASLPFADDSFDAVVCTEVLEHLFAPHRAARELCRVLRPGGVVIVTVPNVAYWRRRAELLFGHWNPTGDHLSTQQPWRDPHIRFFNPRSLRAMLQEAGFCSIAVGGHLGTFVHDLPLRTYVRTVLPTSMRSFAQPQSRAEMTSRSIAGLLWDRISPRHRSSSLYKCLERVLPSLMAMRLYAIATKPGP